ncbi:MAG TPA: cob(I)yrinic acid a,c-diamide adenosyltransferase [Steroidobacteraceae bacterium]|nr:cob(I)yrinic acid a,c-diamide adenosyltransferase [Steroidobacteraceae bacterium]
MGNRLSKIYTRTGDDGTTGLGDGSRVRKDDARVEAYGTVDELNSALGLLLAAPALPERLGPRLTEIQHDLFDLGAELCIPGHRVFTAEHVARLERLLDELNADLPPLAEFILPSGGPATAACHLARTIARRAERRVWALAARDPLNPEAAKYLNRLSDLLFVMARVLVRHERGAEVLWRHERGKAATKPT